ncbi:MAG: hypothetical protein LBF00_02430 [Mycoplasmataceae bacterium]|nr:hypothetical protein [Mycoplasmataceae bacterium]
MKNKVDPNLAQGKNWLFKWLYKNRLVWSMMVTVVIVLCTIVFFLYAFNIQMSFAPVS